MSAGLLADLARGRPTFAPPGCGETVQRHRWLIDVARTGDLSVARLAEAHLDAVAILAEAGRRPVAESLYGVWASASPSEPCFADELRGSKRFCSGIGIVDRALVVVEQDPEPLLADVGVGHLRHDPSDWQTAALSATATGTAHLDGITDVVVVGSAAWYLGRPGFWHGACGPAAWWAGGAIGLVDAAVAMLDDDPHRSAQIGAMTARRWALIALLDQAGRDVDLDPHDPIRAEERARSLRQTVERLSTDVLDRFGRAFGPRPFVSDARISQRAADLHLCLRQHHAERELGALAAVASGRPDHR